MVHTADLSAAEVAAARDLLWNVFDDMTEEDWSHCLGGLHFLAADKGQLVGHAAVVQRQLLHGGHALRCGYVEGVAVRAAFRRRGFGAALMDEAERVIRGAYEIGGLGSSDEALGFYERRGWVRWEGQLSALTPSGVVATPDEAGGIFVLPASAELDVRGELTCDPRVGDLW